MDLKGLINNNDVIISSIEKEQELFQVLLNTIDSSLAGDCSESQQNLHELQATLEEFLEKVLSMTNAAVNLQINLAKAFPYDLVEDIMKYTNPKQPADEKSASGNENRKA